VIYDYAVIADVDGGFAEKGLEDVLDAVAVNGFADLEASIVFGVQLSASAPLSAPVGLTVQPIAGATRRVSGLDHDARILAGLSWDLDTAMIDSGKAAPLVGKSLRRAICPDLELGPQLQARWCKRQMCTAHLRIQQKAPSLSPEARHGEMWCSSRACAPATRM
jgi:hypothetical protein